MSVIIWAFVFCTSGYLFFFFNTKCSDNNYALLTNAKLPSVLSTSVTSAVTLILRLNIKLCKVTYLMFSHD